MNLPVYFYYCLGSLPQELFGWRAGVNATETGSVIHKTWEALISGSLYFRAGILLAKE